MTKAEKKIFMKHHAEMQKIFAAAGENNADMNKCMAKVAECHGRMCECMGKAAEGDDLQKITSAVVASVMEVVNEPIGKMVEPSAVRGAFLTEPPSGSSLIGRAGGPTIPTPAESIDPQFRNLFVE